MRLSRSAAVVAAIAAGNVLFGGTASATVFTSTSPDGLDVTTVGASTVGGIVVVLTGNNGARVVSQAPRDSLHSGYSGSGVNPLTFGSQTGFTNAVTDALGSGLARADFRFTLGDGDTGPGNFDYNDITLLVNDVLIGNWSAVNAENTNADGTAVTPAGDFSGGGFRNSLRDTGWFSLTDAAKLASLFSKIDATDAIVFKLNDVDPNDNDFNFRRGIQNSLDPIVITPVVNSPALNTPVPAPSSLALAGAALIGASWLRRRRRD